MRDGTQFLAEVYSAFEARGQRGAFDAIRSRLAPPAQALIRFDSTLDERTPGRAYVELCGEGETQGAAIDDLARCVEGCAFRDLAVFSMEISKGARGLIVLRASGVAPVAT